MTEPVRIESLAVTDELEARTRRSAARPGTAARDASKADLADPETLRSSAGGTSTEKQPPMNADERRYDGVGLKVWPYRRQSACIGGFMPSW